MDVEEVAAPLLPQALRPPISAALPESQLLLRGLKQLVVEELTARRGPVQGGKHAQSTPQAAPATPPIRLEDPPFCVHYRIYVRPPSLQRLESIRV